MPYVLRHVETGRVAYLSDRGKRVPIEFGTRKEASELLAHWAEAAGGLYRTETELWEIEPVGAPRQRRAACRN